MSLTRLAFALARDAFAVLGWRLPLLFVLTLTSAVLEGLTLAMLLPLFATLGVSGSGGGRDRVTTMVVNAFDTVGLPFTATSVGIFLLIPLAASAVVFLVQAYFDTKLHARYVAHWNRSLFSAVLRSRWGYLRRCRTGDIVNAVTNESDNLGEAFSQTNFIASSGAFMCVQILIAALVAPIVTVAILIFGLFLFAVTRGYIHRALSLGQELNLAYAEVPSAATELLTSVKLVKATATEREATRLFDQVEDRIERLHYLNAFDVQVVRAVFEYASGVAVAFLLIVGPLYLGVEIGAVIVILAMFVRLFPRVTALRRSLQSVALALPSVGNLMKMRGEADAAREQIVSTRTTPHETGPAAVNLNAVQVTGDDGQVILDGIDLAVVAGKFTAIVGSTGAGKSTLVDCVVGLIEPSAGDVTIDGDSLRTISLDTWRRSIGYLGQDAILFAGTVRDNVKWGREDLSDVAIAEALEAAGASFALRLPAGLDTPIGERGGRFSGGERQRIALARALAGTPRLLILDEATSALDVETEQEVAQALQSRRGRITILAITHRLAAVRGADMIAVLDSGRIVEHGTFADLLAAEGRFAAMWRMQLQINETG